MDHLWTPWRYQYISSISKNLDDECIFCAIPQSTEEQALLLYRGEFNYIELNQYPYTSGHVMVIPYRHFANLHEIEPEEWGELGDLTARLQRALQQEYSPDGFNIGWNQGQCAGAGVAGHLHLHLVPRWCGDSNFVGVLGETRVIPEDLQTTFSRLLPYFPPV
jgi:ATP adenylyltransferase